MKILFLGDIFGKSGRLAVGQYLPSLKTKYQPDFIIANAENATHGHGLSEQHYKELKALGIDCFTMGNHFFAKNISCTYMNKTNDVVRPLNIDSSCDGKGSQVFNINDTKIRVTNVLGRVFMRENPDNSPFDELDKIIEKDDSTIHIIDFHAEATSEKMAFYYNYRGKVSAILGTHTHVQTADERVEKGTAYITDAGTCGPYESVIGCDIAQVINKTKTNIPQRLDAAESRGQVNGVIIELDKNGKATSIERIYITPNNDWNI